MEEENRGFFSYGHLPASKHCIYEQTSFPSLTKKVNEGKKKQMKTVQNVFICLNYNLFFKCKPAHLHVF